MNFSPLNEVCAGNIYRRQGNLVLRDIKSEQLKRITKFLPKRSQLKYQLLNVLMSINVDGSPVNEITIDGNQVTEVTIDGTTVWQNTITNGLISRWKLDSGSGSTAVDSYGSIDGDISGASWTSTTTQGDHALNFNGSNDDVYFGTPNSMDGVSEFSVVEWIRPQNVSSDQFCLNKADWDNPTDVWTHKLQSNGSIRADFFDSGGNDFRPQGGSLSTGNWYHLVSTYDSNQAILYINGSSVDSVSTNGNNLRDTTAPVFLAARGSGTTGGEQFFDGIVDDARVYNRALTSSEVSDIYQGKG